MQTAMAVVVASSRFVAGAQAAQRCGARSEMTLATSHGPQRLIDFALDLALLV